MHHRDDAKRMREGVLCTSIAPEAETPTWQPGGDGQASEAGSHDDMADQQQLPPAGLIHQECCDQCPDNIHCTHDDAPQHRRLQPCLCKHLQAVACPLSMPVSLQYLPACRLPIKVIDMFYTSMAQESSGKEGCRSLMVQAIACDIADVTRAIARASGRIWYFWAGSSHQRNRRPQC